MVNKNSTVNILFRCLFSILCAGLIAIGTAESAPKSGKNAASSAGKTRIKDIIDIEGVRDNMLVGYGLVVGLNGTGDTLNNSPFTQQSIIGMLDRLGVNVRDEKVNTKNIAAVIVSATLPPFSNNGTRIDVTISALGDAKSLQGGTLLVTPLLGADSQVYAVAQGPVSVSGFTASGDGGSVTQNIPTAGRIAS
ncbi:MAG: flagellar basal body P-ring protein FlgI, partial [Bdellovibrionales bacterium]